MKCHAILLLLVVCLRLPSLAENDDGLYRGKPAALLPSPAELGAQWNSNGPSGDATEGRVEYEIIGTLWDIPVVVRVLRSTEDARKLWVFRQSIAREHLYTMERVPSLGELGEMKVGTSMTYLHFARANVYVSMKCLGKPDIVKLAKAIDGKLLAAFAGTEPARILRPTYSPEKTQEFFAGIIPLVEEAAGRKFRTPPKLRFVSAVELRRAFAADLNLQSTDDPALAEPLSRAIRADQVAAPRAFLSMGKYAIAEDAVLIPLENFLPALARNQIDPAKADEAMRRVLAHELTHALQGQHVKLATLLQNTRELEARICLNALNEGHASWVEQRVADRLGISVRFWPDSPPEIRADPKDAKTSESKLLAAFELIYEGGRKFAAYHHAHGGNEKLWAIWAAPPRRKIEIVSPERYGEGPGTPVLPPNSP